MNGLLIPLGPRSPLPMDTHTCFSLLRPWHTTSGCPYTWIPSSSTQALTPLNLPSVGTPSLPCLGSDSPLRAFPTGVDALFSPLGSDIHRLSQAASPCSAPSNGFRANLFRGGRGRAGLYDFIKDVILKGPFCPSIAELWISSVVLGSSLLMTPEYLGKLVGIQIPKQTKDSNKNGTTKISLENG